MTTPNEDSQCQEIRREESKDDKVQNWMLYLDGNCEYKRGWRYRHVEALNIIQKSTKDLMK